MTASSFVGVADRCRVELHAHRVAGGVQRLRADHERVDVEVVGLGRVPATVGESAEQLDDRDRVDAADARDRVLPVGREDRVLRAAREGGSDLRGLLAEARHPEAELALPLEVRRLDVEGARDDHVAVEVLQHPIAEFVDVRLVLLGAGVGDEGPLRGEQLDRLGGGGH